MKNKIEHTPGPWKIAGGYVVNGDPADGPRRGAICKMAHNSPIVYAAGDGASLENGANARLIAAAPEMAARIESLEAENKALREACGAVIFAAEQADSCDGELQQQAIIDMHVAIKKARAAISKAKGEK